jgi:hypothetical protein
MSKCTCRNASNDAMCQGRVNCSLRPNHPDRRRRVPPLPPPPPMRTVVPIHLFGWMPLIIGLPLLIVSLGMFFKSACG